MLLPVQAVTLVAVRLALVEAQQEKLQRAPTTTARHLLPIVGSVHHAHSGHKRQHAGLLDAAPAASRQLQDAIAIIAQQFGGHAFALREEEVLLCSHRALLCLSRLRAVWKRSRRMGCLSNKNLSGVGRSRGGLTSNEMRACMVQGRLMLSFASAVDALRFCHAAQVGQTLYAASGRHCKAASLEMQIRRQS